MNTLIQHVMLSLVLAGTLTPAFVLGTLGAQLKDRTLASVDNRQQVEIVRVMFEV